MTTYDNYRKSIVNTIKNKITVKGLYDISIIPVRMEKNSIYDCPSNEKLQEETIVDKPQISAVSDEGLVKTKSSLKEIDHSRECKYYLSKDDFSNVYVDELLKSAVHALTHDYEKSVIIDYSEVKVPNITWPMIQEFNKDLGAIKLEEYIDTTMDSVENWVVAIQYLKEYSDPVSDFYKYEAKFSIPTVCYPIPQATASVFFTYEVSKVKPAHCAVDVSFQLESFNLIMVPGKDLITDSLLFRVIDTKLAIFSKITF